MERYKYLITICKTNLCAKQQRKVGSPFFIGGNTFTTRRTLTRDKDNPYTEEITKPYVFFS